MNIKLKSILPDFNPEEYKIHFAKTAYGVEPLDVYIESFERWKGWNSSSSGKNSFNRKYIFSLISFYPEENTWLFGGVWRVVSRNMRKHHPYEIELVSSFKPLIGRLKISYEYKNRATRVKMENHLDGMVVKEILPEPYFYEFPGYDNLDISFKQLQLIRERGNSEWRDKLSVKGIYLITNTNNNMKYVGKADGAYGIWQRWKQYASNGHGGNVYLIDLVETKGFDYVQKHYKFTLLEPIFKEDEERINEREDYWKRVLLSRNEKYGYNGN